MNLRRSIGSLGGWWPQFEAMCDRLSTAEHTKNLTAIFPPATPAYPQMETKQVNLSRSVSSSEFPDR